MSEKKDKKNLFKEVIIRIVSYASLYPEDKCVICGESGIKFVVDQQDQKDYDSWVEYEFIVLCPNHAANATNVMKNIDVVMDDVDV